MVAEVATRSLIACVVCFLPGSDTVTLRVRIVSLLLLLT